MGSKGSCCKAICLHKTGGESTWLPGEECCQSDFGTSTAVLSSTGTPDHCATSRTTICTGLLLGAGPNPSCAPTPATWEIGAGNALEHSSVGKGREVWGSGDRLQDSLLSGGAHAHFHTCTRQGRKRCSVRMCPLHSQLLRWHCLGQLGIAEIWNLKKYVQDSILHLPSYMTIGKSFHFCEPWCPHFVNGGNVEF